MRSQIDRIRNAIADASGSVRSALSSLRSPPETNARSPAPRDDQRLRALGAVERLVQLVHRLQRDGVAGVRAVDRDDRQCRRPTPGRPSCILQLRYWHSRLRRIASPSDGGAPTHMRNIPVELTKRYERRGLVDARDPRRSRWPADCATNPEAGFCVHSAVRPFAGTFARRRAAGAPARRRAAQRAASDPATWWRFSCRTGWRPRRRSGRRPSSARSWCRSCTSTGARN